MHHRHIPRRNAGTVFDAADLTTKNPVMTTNGADFDVAGGTVDVASNKITSQSALALLFPNFAAIILSSNVPSSMRLISLWQIRHHSK